MQDVNISIFYGLQASVLVDPKCVPIVLCTKLPIRTRAVEWYHVSVQYL